MRKLKIANIQMKVSKDKKDSMQTVRKYLDEIKDQNVDLVILPEMFNCPYETKKFPIYAEEAGGETYTKCASLAKEYGIYLAAGSIPEIEDGKVHNTAFVFNKNGEQIARHRKAHLFDVSVQGGVNFKESETLTPGKDIVVFETEFCKMGLCVCFDFRFPELIRLMADQGAELIIVPAAFNMTTGPAHWEILFRARAMDNQVFATGTAPARDLESSYTSWGHSILVDPWGRIIEQMDEKEGYMINEIDLDEVAKIRGEIPLMNNRRHDMYQLKATESK